MSSRVESSFDRHLRVYRVGAMVYDRAVHHGGMCGNNGRVDNWGHGNYAGMGIGLGGGKGGEHEQLREE